MDGVSAAFGGEKLETELGRLPADVARTDCIRSDLIRLLPISLLSAGGISARTLLRAYARLQGQLPP